LEPLTDQLGGALASVEIRENNEWYVPCCAIPPVNGSAEIAETTSPVSSANGKAIDGSQ
jgi:hypothetical protein